MTDCAVTLIGRDLTECLATASGPGRILGLSRQRVDQLCDLDGFPEPIALAEGAGRQNEVYPVAEVLVWREAHRAAMDAARRRREGSTEPVNLAKGARRSARSGLKPDTGQIYRRGGCQLQIKNAAKDGLDCPP